MPLYDVKIMPLSYEIKDGIVFTKATGKITNQMQEEFTQIWLADPDLPSPILICRDNRGVANATYEEMRWLAEFGMSVIDVPEGTREATVVSSASEYGMAKMYQTMVTAASFSFRIFSDPDEAIRWLRL